MLGAIRAVTTVVPDLKSIEDAYSRYLGYEVFERGAISDETAASWGARGAAGHNYIAMQPESGEAVFLRFIEDPAATGYKAFTTYGWNSTEVSVQDTDKLAERLAQSPFRIIGEPKNLEGFPNIRAMQVIGPAGECLYLTDVGKESGIRLAKAQSFVGRVFITILGASGIETLRDFFHTEFGLEASAPVSTPISGIFASNNLPPDTKSDLSVVALTDGTLIELDGFPDCTTARDIGRGELPIGMSIVTFEVDTIPNKKALGPITTAAMCPHKGGRMAMFCGPGGALIEVVERPA